MTIYCPFLLVPVPVFHVRRTSAFRDREDLSLLVSSRSLQCLRSHTCAVRCSPVPCDSDKIRREKPDLMCSSPPPAGKLSSARVSVSSRVALGSMRAVVQRVTQASVTVDGQVVSSIGRGQSFSPTRTDSDRLCRPWAAATSIGPARESLAEPVLTATSSTSCHCAGWGGGTGILCLIGISTTDTAYESSWLASKLLGLKVFPEDKDGEVWGWKNSVVDAGYEVLCGLSFFPESIIPASRLYGLLSE